MKKIAFLTLLALFSYAKEVVNVYSHRHYDIDKELYKEFEKESGIAVNVVKANAEELIERLKVEGKNSPADVLITVDVANLYQAKSLGLFQPIKSKIVDSSVATNLKDSDNNWVALTKRARVIVYNKEKLSDSNFSTYEDLAEPKWAGKVLIRSSNNSYNQSLVSSMIAHLGEAKTQKWLEGFVKNFAREPKGSDRDQMRAVASGEGDLAIVNTYYLGMMIESEKQEDKDVANKLGIFFPNQNSYGTHINVSGAGILASSKNVANAQKLIEFLLSDKAQELFAKANYEYPIKSNIKTSELVKGFGEFKEDTIKLSVIGENNKKAVELMDKAKWK